jgi:von Willebrand factor type A domain
MRIRAMAGVLPLLGLLGLAPSSRADLVRGTRSEKLTERSHTIDLTFAPGHATLRVRRVLENQGPRHDQAVVDIEVPDGAVATGLRTLGTLNGQPTWFDAELLEAEAAAAKYRELTGIGGYYPKDPALLSWRGATNLKLQVFPVAPKTKKTVEYTLEMPSVYEDGREILHLARLGTEERAAEIVVAPADPRDKLSVAGKVVPSGTHLTFADDPLDIVLERHDQLRLGGELAVVPFGPKRVLSHARVEVSGRLSQAPRGASVVVVLDTSRSLADEDVDAERAAAGAYLAQMPDANVEVITFDRSPHRRYGRLAPVSTAITELERLAIVRRNGSAIDLALAEAENVLLASPPGPRRVVVLTDLRTRRALQPEKLRAAFAKSGAVTHIATIGIGGPSLSRIDDGPWAQLARATGGVQWLGAASNDPALATEMRATFEEWARPLRIDRMTVKTPGVMGDDLALPDTMPEGGHFDLTRIDPTAMSAMVLKGELWSSPIHATLQPEPGRNKLWAALVFGTGVLDELSEPEQMTLAKLGHAVSPVTSLLAIEPGVRPSTEGLEETGMGQSFGIGHGVGSGSHRFGTVGMTTFDHAAFLRGALSQAWAACGGSGKPATVTLETTRAEIVDVESVSVDPSASNGAEACLREATWAVDLPGDFTAEHAGFSIGL